MTDLNRPQREAVLHVGGPLLVLAGAGSGKTRVIAEKIAYLIGTGGLVPSGITAVTFTNKAAREMRERVGRLLGRSELDGMRIGTFHALGLEIIRQDCDRLGLRRGFSIFDEQDSATILAELLQCDRSDPRVADARQQVSRLKSSGADAADTLADVAVLTREYNRQLLARNAVDFDDLIGLPLALLRRHPDLLARWQVGIRHLLVDEYQDTNAAQYELIKLLVGDGDPFTVVGDDDQSIYRWRGAQPENLAQIARDFPGLTVVKLEQNYRSTGRILKAANQLIARNPHVFTKRLWSALSPGDPLRVLHCRDEDDEAGRVVRQLLHHRLMKGGDYGDYAILYRGNHQSRPFERVLREHGVPYAVSGGPSFFEYAEVRDLMAYLRLLANPDDDTAFVRVINTPRREIGPTTVEKLSAFARQRGLSMFAACFDADLAAVVGARQRPQALGFAQTLSRFADYAEGDDPLAAVDELLVEVGYRDWVRETAEEPAAAERRLQNIDELRRWIAHLARHDPAARLADLVAKLTLIDQLERDGAEQDSDRVRLLTLHAAKGLEFPHVYLVGMEEEILPHRASIEAGDVEEERRLAYVGITRARRSLTFSLATSRRRYGETRSCMPSRFLDELPREDLLWEGVDRPSPVATRDEGRQVLANLKAMLD